jgi:hypothetical protein
MINGRIMALEAALKQCADWFQDYADRHVEKGDVDKAKRNQQRADFAIAVIHPAQEDSRVNYETINSTAAEKDPDYTWVPPYAPSRLSKGIQCGECGMKFEHNKSYGYACPRGIRCPCGLGGSTTL